MTRALILGAAVSGMAAARLADRLGMSSVVYDREPPSSEAAFGRSIATGLWDPVLLGGMDVVIASPGFSERSAPIVDSLEAAMPVWSEIEFAARNTKLPMAAVTGTNGKTSVTEAASAMLIASGLVAPAVGNIGSPMSDKVDSDSNCLVVEVSSFQLRFTDLFRPEAAAITNVAVDHLDWHGSEYSYRQAKGRIFANQTASDLLVFDADDAGASELAEVARSELLPVSARRIPPGGVGPSDGRIEIGNARIALGDLASSDATHVVNITIAAALALRLGASPHGVERGAREYHPGAHRRQLIVRSGGISWVDDSKATNPHAALASVEAHRPVILIAGGLAKGLDLSQMASHPGVRVLVGVGAAGPDLVERAGTRGVLAGTLESAVQLAAELARPGDTVLLAPGCASFDQFESYAARGDRFAELVRGSAA